MIPRQLTDVEWADVLELITNQREEDDTIEFKEGFSGGGDFTLFNDRAQKDAVDSLLREILAFLNTRGGDLIIGLKEGEDRPVAVAVTPIPNVTDAAERLARSFAALIEPAQTSVSVRAINDPDDLNQGVILVRVRTSLRAPHRSKRTRECYARRGTESVPMAMDEIQDTTLYRTELRREKLALLSEQFSDLVKGRSEHHALTRPVFHVRVVFFPFVEQSLDIGAAELGSLTRGETTYFRDDGTQLTNDIALRGLERWKPMLRGKRSDRFLVREEEDRFHLASVRLKSSGIVLHELAIRSRAQESQVPVVYWSWLLGFFAQAAKQLEQLLTMHASLLPGVLRVGLRIDGDINLVVGEGFFADERARPNDTIFLPDFHIESVADLATYFVQLQTDIMSLAGEDCDDPVLLHRPDNI